MGCEPWSVTLRVDTHAPVYTARRAAHCHASQLVTTLAPHVGEDAWRLSFGE